MTPIILTVATAVAQNASHARLVNLNPALATKYAWTVTVASIQLKVAVSNVSIALHTLPLSVALLSARAMQGPRVITINALCVRLASTRMKRDPLRVWNALSTHSILTQALRPALIVSIAPSTLSTVARLTPTVAPANVSRDTSYLQFAATKNAHLVPRVSSKKGLVTPVHAQIVRQANSQPPLQLTTAPPVCLVVNTLNPPPVPLSVSTTQGTPRRQMVLAELVRQELSKCPWGLRRVKTVQKANTQTPWLP